MAESTDTKPTPTASPEALQAIDQQIIQCRSQLPYRRDQVEQAKQVYHETLGALVHLQQLRGSLVEAKTEPSKDEEPDAKA